MPIDTVTTNYYDSNEVIITDNIMGIIFCLGLELLAIWLIKEFKYIKYRLARLLGVLQQKENLIKMEYFTFYCTKMSTAQLGDHKQK